MGVLDRLRPRHDGALAATVGGIVDRLRDRAPPLGLAEGERVPGRRVLVTGANRGLGLAVARELVRRGAQVVAACRSGIPEVVEAVRRGGGGPGAGGVEAVHVDFADLGTIEKMVAGLAEGGAGIDVAILNAGVVTREGRRSRYGLDEQFQVNFLANVLLVRRLLERGVIGGGGGGAGKGARPRVVMVSSESHRSAPRIAWERLGVFRPWGMREAVAEYGYSKLLLETWAVELARRLVGEVAVHTVCPGAVRTDLAREAPGWAKPALDLTMRAFFKEPAPAARPVVYLAGAAAIEGETGIYVHVTRRKERSAVASDPENGRRLWEESAALLARAGHAIPGKAEEAR